MKIRIKLLAKPEFVAGKKGDVEVMLSSGEYDHYVDVATLELFEKDKLVETVRLVVARNKRHNKIVVSPS